MTDEKYTFVQDIREKKITARSAYHKRTHCGKGGSVRLPHDNIGKRELKKLNGEMKAYRLNDPMSWSEFKAMPEDLQVDYIKLLREKYGVRDYHIADMMGCHRVTFAKNTKFLPIEHGRGNTSSGVEFREAEWRAFIGGEKPAKVDTLPVLEPEIPSEPEQAAEQTVERAIPTCGSLSFHGTAEAAFRAVSVLLGGANVHLTITWSVPGEGGTDG